MAYELQPRLPIAGELMRTIHEQIGEALAASTHGGEHRAEHAHRARVACKKIRAALRLLRSSHPKRAAREDDFFSDAARAIAPLWDAAAAVATVDLLADQLSTRPQQRALRAVRAALVKAQRSQSAKAKAETLARFASRLHQASGRFATWEVSGDGFPTIAPDFGRSYQAARRAYRTACRTGSVEEIHTWRKRAKTHAYHLRLLRCAWPDVMKPWETSAKELARLLGEEHDLALLRENVVQHHRSLAAKPETTALLDRIEQRRAALRAEALLLGKRIFAERPPELAARVARWWAVAQELPIDSAETSTDKK